MPHELLPPNRTPLETAIADTAPRLIIDDLADTHRLLKFNPPDSILPWLAAEWHLSGFVKYFPDDLRALIDAGLPWLMERGTAAAVKRALSWIGLDVTIEEDGAYLQLDPGRVITPEELADLVYLVKASIPAHVDLYRLYHDYDLRPIGVSQPAALDDGLLSDDSGVWVNVDGEDVKLSFRHRIGRWIDISNSHALYSARRDTRYDRTWYEDRARLSVWHLDSEIIPNRRVVLGQVITSGISGAGGINANPPTLGRHLNIARAAIDLDNDADPLGDLNCGFAGGIDIEYNPFVLDESALSDHDNDLRCIFIDERLSENRTAAVGPVNPAGVSSSILTVTTSRQIARSAGEHWRGAWDTRRWYAESIRIPSKLTHTEA